MNLPDRIQAAIADMIEVLGERRAVVARELTKLHEEFIYGSLCVIADKLGSAVIKGEFTVVVEGCPAKKKHDDQ